MTRSDNDGRSTASMAGSKEDTRTAGIGVAEPLPKKGFACRSLIFVRNCFVVGVALVLIIAVLVAPSIDFSCKKYVSNFDLLFFGGALIVILLSAFLVARRSSRSSTNRGGFSQKATHAQGAWSAKTTQRENRIFKRFVLIGTVVLLALQAFILIGGRFVTGWDVWFLIGPDNPEFMAYFSRYPNQLFLHGVFAGVSNLLGVFVKSNHYLAMSVMSIVSVTLAVVMASFIAKRLAGFRVGVVTFLMAAVMCGLSPWIMVPYSDTFGMLFTVLILWAYVCLSPQKEEGIEASSKGARKKQVARWAIIGFASVMGYYIKPTIIFVFLSIVLIEICVAAARRHARRRGGSISGEPDHRTMRDVLLRTIAPCVIGFILAYGCVSFVKSTTYDVEEQAAFSPMHFLMLGANGATGGVYSDLDMLYSESFGTIEDRNRANLKEYLFRVNSRSLAQNAEFVMRKACTNFADGSFAWEVEGDFYQVIVGKNPIVLKFYGIDSLDWSTAAPFEYIAQFLWILVLLSTFLIVLGSRPSKTEVVMALTLLMLGAFLMVFEARARYLLLYLPYVIVLAVIGWNRLCERFAKRRCS